MKRHSVEEDVDGGGSNKKMKMMMAEAEVAEKVAVEELAKQVHLVATESNRLIAQGKLREKQLDVYKQLDLYLGARIKADLTRRQDACTGLWRRWDDFVNGGISHQSCGTREDHPHIVIFVSTGPEGCSGCFDSSIEHKSTVVSRKPVPGCPDKITVNVVDDNVNLLVCRLLGDRMSFDRLCAGCIERIKADVAARQQCIQLFVSAVSDVLGLDLGNLTAAYYYTPSQPRCFHCLPK